MSIKVSVIVPVYNGENFLRRAIESIVNQTYTSEYELLLLDDGSTDGTAAICKEYAEKYPFVRYHYQENVGLTRARENAIKLVQGKYIGWLDSDDYVSPNLLEVTMKKIEETGADICVYSYRGIYANGKTKEYIRKDQSLSDWRKGALTGEVTSVWSYICKKELWENEPFPWQVWRCGEDGYITPIVFQKAKSIVSVPEILYFYMLDNPESMTHNYSGIKLFGSGYALYHRFNMGIQNFPETEDYLGNKTLRLFARAYCVSAYLKDLKEEDREIIRTYILDVADRMKRVPFRNAYRVFLIRHRWNSVIEFMGKLSCKDRDAKNEKAKKMMKN